MEISSPEDIIPIDTLIPPTPRIITKVSNITILDTGVIMDSMRTSLTPNL